MKSLSDRGGFSAVRIVFVACVLSLLGGCFGDDEDANKPKMDFIHVVNNSSTEAQVRVKMWQKKFIKVTSGKEETIEFQAQPNTVQVEVKSRKQWDDCWVTMQKTETLEVFDDGERIGCRVD